MRRILSVFNPESVKKYFANTSWLMAEKILRAVITLFVGIYVARYLGPADFGLLSYCLSFVALFSTVATLGLNAIVVRDLVNSPRERDTLLGTAFWLKMIGAIISIGFVWVGIQFTSNDSFTNLLIYIIASGIIFKSFNVIDFYFQAKVQSKYTAIAMTSQVIITSLLKIYLILTQASLLSFGIVIFLENLVLSLGLIILYLHNKLSVYHWKLDLSKAKVLLKDSTPLIFSGIFVSIYMRIDQVMIQAMLDNTAVGFYAVAVKICEATYFIPLVITSSVFPAILHARNSGADIYQDRLQRLYDVMILIALAIAIPLTVWGNNIIEILFGTQFVPAGTVLKIYIWSALLTFLGIATEKWFFAENLQIYALYRTLSGAISNIVLNLILIPRYGINGAASATLISYFIASYFSMAFMKKGKINFIMASKSFNIFASIKRLLNVEQA